MSSNLGGKESSILGGVDNLSDFSDSYDGVGVNIPYEIPEDLQGNIKPMKSKKNFRFAAKQVFLTYPRCDMSREELLAGIRNKIGNVDSGVICQEHHEDGGLHLHAYFSFKKTLNIKKSDGFDINDHHPHISKVRCLSAVIRYLGKEDKNLLAYNCDVAKMIVGGADKKASTTSLVGQMILDGKSPLEIARTYTAWATRLPQLVASIQTYKALLEDDVPSYRHDFIAYWIYGDAGIGKSYSVRLLAGESSIYFKSFNCRFWDGYKPEKHKCVIFDDYHGEKQFSIADLKRVADAYDFMLDMKGSCQIHAKYVTFVVTSNFSIEDCLINSKMTSKQIMEPIKRRFIEINANNYKDDSGFFNFEYFLDKNLLTFYKKDWESKYPELKGKDLSFDKIREAYNKYAAGLVLTTRKCLGIEKYVFLKDLDEYNMSSLKHSLKLREYEKQSKGEPLDKEVCFYLKLKLEEDQYD